jgi:hypothetical protein
MTILIPMLKLLYSLYIPRYEGDAEYDGSPSVDRGDSFEGWSVESVCKCTRHISRIRCDCEQMITANKSPTEFAVAV